MHPKSKPPIPPRQKPMIHIVVRGTHLAAVYPNGQPVKWADIRGKPTSVALTSMPRLIKLVGLNRYRIAFSRNIDHPESITRNRAVLQLCRKVQKALAATRRQFLTDRSKRYR